jgi:hypothetical protein
MSGDDDSAFISDNGVCEAKFLDTPRNLLDLLLGMSSRVTVIRLEVANGHIDTITNRRHSFSFGKEMIFARFKLIEGGSKPHTSGPHRAR